MAGSTLSIARCNAAIAVLIVLVAVNVPTVSAADRLRPTFHSEVRAPEESVILPLLKAACGQGVRTVTAKGQHAFGCGDGSMDEILESRHGPRRYPWMPYVLWEAEGVIFGHFLSATSEDAAISCLGCEGHPELFGGTLLLTKKADEWKPVWYKAGVITRHCRRASLATGRQILFCEETDGGMGHRIHGLYSVDFRKPKFAWHSVVLMADSYSSTMLGGVQEQSIDRVSFQDSGHAGLLVRVYVHHGRIKLRADNPYDNLPKPRLSSYEIDFRLDGDSFKVTPETAAVAKLFGVGSR